MGAMRWFIILMLGLGLPCAASAHEGAAGTRWQTDHLVDHPLVGKIWDAAAGEFISPALLYDRLQLAYFVLFGEVHSNPDHHRLQRRAIEHLFANERRPTVVLEMFESGHQAAIERIRDRYPNAADRIARETEMEDRGWPWPLYKPLIEWVLAHALPLAGADLSRSATREIVSAGLESLGTDRVKALALDEPLAPVHMQAMRADIVTSHCGHARARLIEGMIAAQRARDAWLADGLVAHASRDGAVLIAGSGHVRNDFAAPAYLRRRAPQKTMASLAFTEVDRSKTAPENYVTANTGERPVFDYLWFTPRSQSEHPCAEFENSLRKLDRSEARE